MKEKKDEDPRGKGENWRKIENVDQSDEKKMGSSKVVEEETEGQESLEIRESQGKLNGILRQKTKR